MGNYWEQIQKRDGNPLKAAKDAERRREMALAEEGKLDFARMPRKRKRDLVTRMVHAAKPTRVDLELRGADELPPRRS